MIKETFDELYECCNYCMLAVNGYEKELDKNIHDKAMLEALEKRNKSVDAIKEMMPKNMVIFFKHMNESKATLANMLTLSFYDYQATTLNEAKKIISNKFHTFSLTYFPPFSLHMGGFSLGNNDEGCPFTDSLSALELSDENKFHILSAFMNFDNTINQLFDYFESVKQYLPVFNLNNFVTYWQKESTLLEFKSFLKKRGVEFDQKNERLLIMPTSYLPNTFSFMADEDCDDVFVIIGHALSIDLLASQWKQKKVLQKELILKLLSDPSKYEILKMIKDKAYYGAEIAKAMNLKTSTISYHLNACVDAHLVNLEKIENKIYFELNHQTMNAFIEALKDDFKEK